MAQIVLPEETIMLGSPPSSAHQFSQIEMRNWMVYIAGLVTAGVAYQVDDLADLPDASTVTDGAFGFVLNDATEANRGVYQEQSDAWVKVAELPDVFTTTDPVILTAGGTANAITATANRVFQTAVFAETFTFQAVANNTGAVTLAIDGGFAYPLVTNSGNALTADYLVSGSVYDFRFDGTNYRLTSTVSDAAVLAAAEAAQLAAETAQAGAETARTGAETAETGAVAARVGAETAEDNAVAAAEVAGGGVPYDTRADAVAGADPDGTIVLIFADENFGGTRTLNVVESGVIVQKVILSERIDNFDSVAELVADTVLAYGTPSAGNLVQAGDIITAGGLRYEVAASGATDNNIATTGGVKLYALPTPAGFYNAAAWNPAADGVTDDTAVLQDAIDYAHDNNADLFIPAGTYLVTGLTIPGTVTGTDERGKAFRIFGQGCGEPFVVNHSGTTIRSVTAAPVFQDILDTNPSSNGTFVLEKVLVEGNNDAGPVILLQSFYGLSRLRDMVVKNLGDGDGIEITYTATTELNNIYVMNGDATTPSLGVARTGVGVKYAPSIDAGLFTCRKVTSRGWLTGFEIGNGAEADFTTTISDCECSTNYNGIILAGTRGATVEKTFFEGGEGGVGITDAGNYTTIENCTMFQGYSIGIDASDTTSEGTVIEKNTINVAALANSTCCHVASSAAFGGNSKTVRGNTFAYTLGTAGVTGLLITGINPVLDTTNNHFSPRGGWTGTGTTEIDDQSTLGVYGMAQRVVGANASRIPVMSNGAVSFYRGDTLTEADVVSSNMTIPPGSYFPVTASVATTVQRFTCGPQPGRIIILRTTNANLTIQNTVYVKLAGGVSFTGAGTITFVSEQLGGETYFYEIARAVF